MRFRILLMTLAVASLSGCLVVSLNPLFTEKELIFKEQLVGTWEGDDSQMVIAKGEDSTYRMTYLEQDERSDYKLSLGKLGSHLFWNMQPWEEPSDDDFLLIQTHMTTLISLEQDTLTMALLDGDWVRKSLKNGTIQIGHQLYEDRVLLTASTAQLQTFFRAIAENEEAFPDPATYRRVR